MVKFSQFLLAIDRQIAPTGSLRNYVRVLPNFLLNVDWLAWALTFVSHQHEFAAAEYTQYRGFDNVVAFDAPPTSHVVLSWRSDTMNKPTTTAPQRAVRLLIPIDAGLKSDWGVRYALKVVDAGQVVEVIFLNVGEQPSTNRVKQYQADKDSEAFQVERAEAFISEACKPLLAKSIPCRGFFKQGEVVRSIIDIADEFEVDEVVLPQPTTRWWKLFGSSVSADVCSRYRKGIVVLINKEGLEIAR